jgi:hypothetical protein
MRQSRRHLVDSQMTKEECVFMQWQIFPQEHKSGDWVVQGIDIADGGKVYTTIFSDSGAERRAHEYLEWCLRADRFEINYH